MSVEERAIIERALARSVPERRGYALGVDRRTTYFRAREVLSAGLAAGLAAVELRVGDRTRLKAIRSCAVVADLDETAVDCWGRRSLAPERSRDDGGAVTDAGARPPTDGGTATGDVVEAPSAFAWDRTLSLALSVETDYVRIEVQGRVLRTLGHRPNERATLDATLRSLGQSLESLRRNNGWDRRVSVRTADAVVWGDLVAVLNVLVEAGFDQLVLTHVAAGG